MKTTFACPDCGALGSADASLEGRQVRCKHCNYRFAVPGPSGAEAEGYLLDEPTRATAKSPAGGDAIYVPSRGDEPVALSPRRPKRTTSGPKRGRKSPDEGPDFAWRSWLIRLAAFAGIVLVGIALIVPRGLIISGSALMLLGMVMVLIGFGAGAYGAFCEDFLYFILYMAIPIYTAYYVVTRWDDLRPWLITSTAGVGLVTLGAAMLRWGGISD